MKNNNDDMFAKFMKEERERIVNEIGDDERNKIVENLIKNGIIRKREHSRLTQEQRREIENKLICDMMKKHSDEYSNLDDTDEDNYIEENQEDDFEERVRGVVKEELSKARPITCPKCGHGLIEKSGASGVKCPNCKWFKLD